MKEEIRAATVQTYFFLFVWKQTSSYMRKRKCVEEILVLRVNPETINTVVLLFKKVFCSLKSNICLYFHLFEAIF